MEQLPVPGPKRVRMTVTIKGQVTIPQEFREKYHIDAPGLAVWVDEGDRLVLKRVPSPREMQGILRKGRTRSGPSSLEELRQEHARELEHDRRKYGV
jgi:bifunctional DNA-binding transcriptional regulator/antitoxin component of YhaV-PrlF toxin-antitoxin module